MLASRVVSDYLSSPKEQDVHKRHEPVWEPAEHPGSWRAVWAYSKRRATRDNQTLTAQANRTLAVIAVQRHPKATRFITPLPCWWSRVVRGWASCCGHDVLPLSSNDPGGESHLRQPGAGDR